jgi:thioredoxin-dependent peroxiredoxin
MKLKNHQLAPHFNTRDVYGNELDLRKLRGQKLYLVFERNAGCPVCNLHTHDLLKRSRAFESNQVKVVMVYESPDVVMKEYLGENNYPFHFVSDPKNDLYNLYGVERSFLKVFKALFNGIMSRIKKGNKLFTKPMKQDGHMDRIPAEFVINEDGKIKIAHYGKFVGDHLPIDVLLAGLR